MKIIIMSAALYVIVILAALPSQAATQDAVTENYAKLVHANYKDAYTDALALQQAIDAMLASPTNETLEAAKKAWLISRDSYGQTEAFRFYEGPIDFVDSETGAEGPEGRLNAWPLNEAYIDYVQGDEKAGIVQNTGVTITKESLTEKNQELDEADVATGYHAIEFLLWGQDLSLEGPGDRPVSDYAKTQENERRRAYLKAVTDLLTDDLKFLVDSWEPGKDNYAQEFVSDEAALDHMLTALATLSGFELASERLATALDSGDQEDEHSCFSDNTHNDFIMNAKGISNVYFGTYKEVKGPGIYDLLKAENEELAEEIAAHLKHTESLIARLPRPIDRELLATPADSVARKLAEKVITSLQTQADLFKSAGDALGVDVNTMSE